MTRRSRSSRPLLALFSLPRLIGRAVRAWYTLEPSHWSRLADSWQTIVAAFPESVAVRSIHARVLRSARLLPAAVTAGEHLLRLAPTSGTAYLEQGKALRAAGERHAAIASFVAAWHHGQREPASRELCRYGARNFLPEPEPGIAALADYPAFAASTPPPPAPLAKSPIRFNVLVEGSGDALAITSASLAEQTYPNWQRVSETGTGAATDLMTFDIALPAGTRLAPQALAWFAWAIAETGCAAVRGDYDVLAPDGTTRASPVLLPALDRLWDRGGSAAILARRNGATGPVVHIPLVLASCPDAPCERPPVPAPVPGITTSSISVVIPTRDNPQMLRAAVDALFATAAVREDVEIVVVDNGSITPEAIALLAVLAREPGVVVVPFDAPFNWSRANNLGARAARGQHLLFLNDDTEMQTAGWDRVLAGLLQDPEIGVVGARLLYPNGTIQHAGFVFGMDNGPQHEGRWMPGDDPGPDGRWLATREAVAVTGAFIAVRSTDFAEVDGFDDTRFAVDFADVDFCLRLRARGQAVVYCGGVAVLHHESVSRGLNLSRVKRARMRRETATLRQRWGSAIDQDPFYHPAWSRTGCSFDGLTAMSQADVMDYILRQAVVAIEDDRHPKKIGTS